jgi:hypothetical protein
VDAGKLGTKPWAAKPADRLAVQALGGLAVAQQLLRTGLDPQLHVGSACSRRFGQQVQGIGGNTRAPAAPSGFDQLEQPHQRAELPGQAGHDDVRPGHSATRPRAVRL